MHEHRSRVYEIERARRKRIAADVVPDDLDVRGVYLGQQPDLQVRGDHAPGRTDDLRQPPGDRPPPPADLQTPSTLVDSKTLNAPLRQRVETLLQQLKTARFIRSGMRERIVRCLTHSQNCKPRCSSPPGRSPDLAPERSSGAPLICRSWQPFTSPDNRTVGECESTAELAKSERLAAG